SSGGLHRRYLASGLAEDGAVTGHQQVEAHVPHSGPVHTGHHGVQLHLHHAADVHGVHDPGRVAHDAHGRAHDHVNVLELADPAGEDHRAVGAGDRHHGGGGHDTAEQGAEVLDVELHDDVDVLLKPALADQGDAGHAGVQAGDQHRGGVAQDRLHPEN